VPKKRNYAQELVDLSSAQDMQELKTALAPYITKDVGKKDIKEMCKVWHISYKPQTPTTFEKVGYIVEYNEDGIELDDYYSKHRLPINATREHWGGMIVQFQVGMPTGEIVYTNEKGMKLFKDLERLEKERKRKEDDRVRKNM
jgi:hypothetical protein